jgi:phage-related baseplate assembly protein
MPDTRSFPDISFLDTDAETVINRLISSYEAYAGKTLAPASPERLLILWLANVIIQERVLINEAAKQNVPRYALGENLDSLAELFRDAERLPAQPATTTIRFYISEALATDQLIPSGTRVTDASGDIVFATSVDSYVTAGALYADAAAVCQTAGAVGNDYVAGQISNIIDVFPHFTSCANTTTSSGGSDVESDDAFYARMRLSVDTYSVAGSAGAYAYYAKSVNSNIADVKVTTPSAGNVNVVVLMNGGELPSSEVLGAVEAALSADDVRPLTDAVTALAPTPISYDIEFTYYIPSGSSIPSSVIEAAVATAVTEYKAWQSAKLGRDVNPSKLVALLMETGIKRVAVTSPVYAAVDDDEVAMLGTESVTNGGFEDE